MTPTIFDAWNVVWQRLADAPVLLLLLTLAPLAALAYWRNTFPTRQTAAAMLLPVAISLGLFWKQDVLPLVATLDLVLLAVVAWDWFSLPPENSFTVRRNVQRIASLRKPHPVSLTFCNQSSRDFLVALRDDLPMNFAADESFDDLSLPARSRVTVSYNLDCPRRGAHRMEHVYLNGRSRWGFWQRLLTYDVADSLDVYPDMQQLSKYALLARTNRLSLMGVRRQRRIGQDNEFERLRDFTRDDHYKHIDWRSTARRNKLTVRDYQINQSQRVMFLIDCGRMMVNQAGKFTLLDHALNSMLMLSYVALRQGDAVGALAFSDEVHAYVPAQAGMQQMNHLLHASFDRFPRLVESRYDRAFFHLASRSRRRSLVILITNIIDDVNAEQVRRHLGSAGRRHLPLCVLLRDHQIFDAAMQPAVTDKALYTSAAASGILTWRRQVLNQLGHQGVLIVDEYPEQLTAPLVNRYLDLKARHLL